MAKSITKSVSLDDSPAELMGEEVVEAAAPAGAPVEVAEAAAVVEPGGGEETSVVSLDMLGGQTPQPGQEIRLRVTSVNPEDGTVTVAAIGGNKKAGIGRAVAEMEEGGV